jgi:hypothetical protein
MTGLNTQSIRISGTLLGKIIRAGAMHFDDVEQVALAIVDLPDDAKIMEIQEVERDADMFVMHWFHPDLTGMGRGGSTVLYGADCERTRTRISVSELSRSSEMAYMLRV